MSFTLVDARGPHRVRAGVVSSNYSDFLGLRPLHGRLFDPAEDRLGAEPVLVLSHGYWMDRFGGDPAVVGQRVRMNGSDHEIVGVLPPTPQFPHENDLYLPISICPTRSHPLFIGDRSARMMYAYGRLRPGVALAEARMDLERVAGGLRAEHGEVYDLGGGYAVDAVPLRDQIVGRARPVVTALLAVSGLLLLIACANAGSLALARARRRARELDLRSALGAGGGRLVGTLLLEGVLLALAGGTLGLLVAFGGHDVLVRFAARFTTRAGEIELDRTVLLFTFAASVVAGLVFGSVPGWLVGRSRGRLEGGGAGTRRRDRRLQRALVTGQVAFAFGVVATAGFALRTAWHVSRAEVGFETESVLTFHIMLDDPRYAPDDAFIAFWADAMSGIRALPQVAAAGRANEVPFGSADDDPRHAFFLRGPSDEAGTAAAAAWRVVDPEVFEVLGLRVELGNGLGGAPAGDPRAAVVNRTFWDRYVAGRLDLGATLRRCDENGRCDPPMRVVGVVSDGRYDLPEHEAGPEVYQRADPSTWRSNDVLVRVAGGDPLAVAADIRALVADIDPQVALADVMTLEELRRERSAPQRFFALLLLAFAAVGAGLALAGVFGVASLAAASRLRELGIRRALGATGGSLGALVVREGLAVTLPGLALGLALAIAGGALLARSLPDAAPVDPLSLALTGALFLLAALVAIWLPARRAARADAAEILHAP
jgi:putative ABC transport system permease protein